MHPIETFEIKLASEVLERMPDLTVEFLLAEANPRARADAATADDVAGAVRESHGSSDALAAHPLDDCYREFYRSMGLKAAQVTNPVKQARRALEHGYRPVAPVVDAAMKIEYATLVSFQLYDASALPADLTYRLARGDEPITTTRGESKVCKPGELVLAGPEEIVHSSYYGNARESVLTPDTGTVLVRILRVPGFPESMFAAATNAARREFDWLAAVRLSTGWAKGCLAPAALEVRMPAFPAKPRSCRCAS